MKRFYTLLIMAALFAVADVYAQVSVTGATPKAEATFTDKVKTEQVKVDYQSSDAQRKAERMALRKERNTIEVNAGITGSLTNFNSKWQTVNGTTNSITGIANFLFTHNYKKGVFNIDNKITGKLGVTNKAEEWTKSQDEWFISTAPAYKMTDQWNFGAIASLRSQFANGVNGKYQRVSRFFAPAYLNVSVGFTYVSPKPKFPIKINLAPISMSATYVTSQSVKNQFFFDKFGFEFAEANTATDAHQPLTDAQRKTPYAYGLSYADGSSRYEGGSSVQIDFDRTFGAKQIFRYRTTFYSFYGWVNEITQQTGENKKLNLEHIAPTVRWEHTIDIKATKYFSTQFYFQMYYNKAQCQSIQTQIVLGVGLSYTFKNK
ncbi:MAG: DUF3078 domain-containing protein [Alistipes sp.]|nr:DUF3078 domain-containing protein [Alistipes sp.]